MRIGLVSLGCAKNLVDSEMVLGMFKASGDTIVTNPEEADVIVINTCGFIDASKQESIDNILAMSKYPAKLVVIGCLVERYLDDLKLELPEVDLWIPIRDYAFLPQKIASLFPNEKRKIVELSPFRRLLSTPKYSAYLRISEGCNNRCTYCAIPLIRGNFRSRPFDEIIEEAAQLNEAKIKELVVISQDTTNYGHELKEKKDIVDLLTEILKFPSFKYIRLLYLYPVEITDRLIALIRDNPRIVPYFDLPIQHSSDHIRKMMHRKGTRKEIMNLIEKIRLQIPEAIIRSTIIVGFPGETEEDFADLIEFVKEIKFDHLGAFPYSREEGTAAYDMPDQISDDIKKKRYSELMRVQRHVSYIKNKAQIGKVIEGIVIDYDTKKNLYYLRGSWNAPDDIDGKITFTSDYCLREGKVVKVKITDAYVYDLNGVEVR